MGVERGDFEVQFEWVKSSRQKVLKNKGFIREWILIIFGVILG